MKIYKDSYNKFWMDNETYPSGLHSISFSTDNLICKIRNINTEKIIYNGLITNLLKENNSAYTNRLELEEDGTTQEIINEVGNFTREELVKAKDNAIVQRDKMQELVNIATRKVELVDEAILNNLDYIVL